MKKFFGRDKPKAIKSPPGARELAPSSGALVAPQDDSYFYVQSHQSLPERSPARVSTDEHWDVVTTTSDGASPTTNPHSVRAVSPYGSPAYSQSKSGSGKDQALRKKPVPAQNAVAALGILKALDPLAPAPIPEQPLRLQRQMSEDYGTEYSYREREERRDRKGFWERATERNKEKERERERQRERERREDQDQNELTRMIGYLTATSSEDWSLVLEVCERASSSENNAKEAVKALRKEFKYAEPAAQLSAARLWAIMIRNCQDTFMVQCSQKKFLETLEDVLQSQKTSPVVRERLIEVLAGAAYSSPRSKASVLVLRLFMITQSADKDGRHDRDGFRGLWRKVKSPDQPDEGIPFHTDDAMFNPPTVPKYPQPPTIAEPSPPTTPTPNTPQTARPPNSKQKSSRHKIIPPDEDMRRLFEECQIGISNAQVLSEELTFAKPEDLKEKTVIREFYTRCRASQELIYSQLNWAYSNAEKSREATNRVSTRQHRIRSGGDPPMPIHRSNSAEEPAQLTREEELLAALLHSNEQLTEAIRLYDDLERVGLEREAEERSKKETRIDRSRVYYDQDGQALLEPPQPYYGGGSSHSPSPAPSPSPSPTPSGMAALSNTTHNHHLTHRPAPIPTLTSNSYVHHPHISSPSLAPPPPAPHGPRLPTHSTATRSRTPSPDRSSVAHSNYQHDRYTDVMLHHAAGKLRLADDSSSLPEESEDEDEEPPKPSAKALGKRRQVEVDESESFDPDDLFYEHANEATRANEPSDDDSDDMQRTWQHHHPVQYAYDAAAERMKARLQAQLNSATVPGVVH
ncbi:hypothetical protein BC835DRAFT_306317 [Cytidiella melzeri]|nr:hypothetical protein BC835DRAFT_306317 [Cytidiella melzeri]